MLRLWSSEFWCCLRPHLRFICEPSWQETRLCQVRRSSQISNKYQKVPSLVLEVEVAKQKTSPDRVNKANSVCKNENRHEPLPLSSSELASESTIEIIKTTTTPTPTIERRRRKESHTMENGVCVIPAKVSDTQIDQAIKHLTRRTNRRSKKLQKEEEIMLLNIPETENFIIEVTNASTNATDRNEKKRKKEEQLQSQHNTYLQKQNNKDKDKDKGMELLRIGSSSSSNSSNNTRADIVGSSEKDNGDKLTEMALHLQHANVMEETFISQVYLSYFRSSVINPFNGKLLSIYSDSYKLLERLGFQRRADNMFQLEWNAAKFEKQVQKCIEFNRTRRRKKIEARQKDNKCASSSVVTTKKNSKKEKDESNTVVRPTDEFNELLQHDEREEALHKLIRPLELVRSGNWKHEVAELLRRKNLIDCVNDDILRKYAALTHAYFPAKLDASLDPSIASGMIAAKLTIDQQNIVALALRGYHIYIGGSAGTGKTVLLKIIFRELSRLQLRVAMTATTGVAAVQLGGCTFHHAFNVPLEITASSAFVDSSSSGSSIRRRWDTNALRAVDVLIIDEVSLLDAEMIDAFDMEARLARMNNAPFGGIQVIACGDFLQLSNGSMMDALPAYMSDAFKHLIHVKLTTPMRHTEGDALIQLLTDLRCGRFNGALFASLDRPIPEHTEQITYIFPRRREAQALNDVKLSELETMEMMCVPQRGPLRLFGRFTPSALIEWSCNVPEEVNGNDEHVDNIRFSSSDTIPTMNTASSCEMKSSNTTRSRFRSPERHEIIKVVQEELERIAPNVGFIADYDVVIMPTRSLRPAILLRLRYPDSAMSNAFKGNLCISKTSPESRDDVILPEKTPLQSKLTTSSTIESTVVSERVNKESCSDIQRLEMQTTECKMYDELGKWNTSGILPNKCNDMHKERQECTETENSFIDMTRESNSNQSTNTIISTLSSSSPASPLSTCKGLSGMTMSQYEELVHCVAERLHGRVKTIFDEEPQSLIPLSVSMALADVTNTDIATTLMPLRLKLGCRVMVNRNLSRSVSNGSVGVVEAFARADVNLFPRRREMNSMNYFKYMSSLNLFDKLPVIRLLSGEVIQVPPVAVTIGGSAQTFFYGYEVYVIPLQLGYGFTVHKVQGLTLQGTVVLDCKNFFECPHLIYVACSRVRKIDQLIVRNITPEMVIVKKSALEFSNSLLDASDTAALSRPLEMVRAAWTKRIQPRIFSIAE